MEETAINPFQYPAKLKFPADEQLWVSYFSNGALKFLITSKPGRSQYVLYKITDEKLIRLGKAPLPTDLEEEFHINERISESITN